MTTDTEEMTSEFRLTYADMEYLVDGLAVLRREANLRERGYSRADSDRITELRARFRRAMADHPTPKFVR